MSMTLAQQHKAAENAMQAAITNEAETLFNSLKKRISDDLRSNPPTINYYYPMSDNTYSSEVLLAVRDLMLDEGVEVDFIRLQGGLLEALISYVEA